MSGFMGNKTIGPDILRPLLFGCLCSFLTFVVVIAMEHLEKQRAVCTRYLGDERSRLSYENIGADATARAQWVRASQ